MYSILNNFLNNSIINNENYMNQLINKNVEDCNLLLHTSLLFN